MNTEELKRLKDRVRHLETVHKEYEEKYRRLEANIPGMVYTFCLHPDGSYAFPYVSPESIDLFGLNPEDVMRDSSLLSELIHPDDRDRRDESIRRSAETLQPWREELRHIVNGEVRWLDCMSRPEKQPNGDILWDGIMLDITEQVKAERALRESEDKYRTLFETMTQGVIYHDMNGKITGANPSAERILGEALDNLMSRTVSDPRWTAINEDGTDCPVDAHPVILALKTGKEVRNKVLGIFKPGASGVSWLNVNAVPQFRPDSKRPYQVYTTVEDITELRQAIHDLNLTQFTLDKASEAVFWVDPQGRIVYVNEEACRALNYTSEELKSLHLWDIDPTLPKEDQWPGDLDPERDLMASREYLESFHIRKDGTKFPVEVKGNIISYGDTSLSVSFVRDITQRKLNEEKLKESEERFRIIFEQAAIGVAQIITSTGNFSRINRKFLDILGYTNKEMMRLTLSDIIHPDDRQAVIKNMQKLTEGRSKSFSLETRFLRNDGAAIWVNLNVSPMWKPGESLLYHIATVEDITPRKMDADLIKRSERQLKEANSTKDKLFSIISHDLRSPFQSILGFSELLLSDYEKADDEKIRNYITHLNISSRSAYFLLENLLSWARDQKGGIVIKKEALHLGKLVEESIGPYLTSAENKRLKVMRNIPDNIFVEADKHTIRTVICNLVNNAIKFTQPGGSVDICASVSNGSVRFAVTDTGIGMDRAMIDQVTKGGLGESRPGTDRESGTGLGLKLCKDFIEKNGGNLHIESETGKGSSFSFILPMAKNEF